MMQSIHPIYKITINIECFEDVPEGSRYCAWITEPEQTIPLYSGSVIHCRMYK